MKKYSDIVLALAGVCQGASMVPKLANQGTCEYQLYRVGVKSLFNTSPTSVIDVFDNLNNLKTGLSTLSEILYSGQSKNKIDLIRYVFGSLHLANKLRRNEHALTKISSKLSSIGNGESALDGEVSVEKMGQYSYALAGVYTDIISPLTTKIKVTGKKEYLQNTLVQAKIRTTLFACIRAGILWYQVGGRRLQFIGARKKLLQTAHCLINSCAS